MRRIHLEDSSVLIIGNDRQIRSLYKRMERHNDFVPMFSEPKFHQGGMYGLVIEDYGEYWVYWVVSSDTIVRFQGG